MATEDAQCIGIILDGNRRWARERGLPTLEGHRAGYERLAECARWVMARGISHLVVYAFSTENWNRSEEEVGYLMSLLRELARTRLRELSQEGIRIRFIGARDLLPGDMPRILEKTEAESSDGARLTLWVALSYGGRQEIVEAVRILAAEGGDVSETALRKHFWSADMPDPDIIIRTGGEQRLSNFLLWQTAYSELFFLPAYWPDFTEIMLDQVLEEYQARERRRGR